MERSSFTWGIIRNSVTLGNEDWLNTFSRQIDQSTIPELSGMKDLLQSPAAGADTAHAHQLDDNW